MQGYPLCTVHHGGREIVIAESHYPLRKLSAERYHFLLRCVVDVLLFVAQFTTQVVYAITAPKPTAKVGMFCTSHIYPMSPCLVIGRKNAPAMFVEALAINLEGGRLRSFPIYVSCIELIVFNGRRRVDVIEPDLGTIGVAPTVSPPA